MNVPPQDVITRDNVSVKIAAVVYFRVVDPNSALTQVEQYLFAVSQLAQTTLRSVCGQAELDQISASERGSTPRFKRLWTRKASPGEWCVWWRSRTSICRRTCSGLWRNRRRQNGRGGPRLFMRRASFKPRKNYPTRRRFWPNSRHLFTPPLLQALSQVAIEKNHTIIVPVPLDLLASFQR